MAGLLPRFLFVHTRCMGFCLFEHATTRDIFFAVNSAHVLDVVPQAEQSRERPVCLLTFGFKPQKFQTLAVGSKADIESLLREAAKIALMKAEVHILTGQRMKHPKPLLLNQPDRVALVREMFFDEFAATGDESFVTASELFMADGAPRQIVERPGTFVLRANVNLQAPILKIQA